MRGMHRSRRAVIVLAVLAAASSCLIIGTAVNYMRAAKAASGFSALVSGIGFEGSAGEPTVRVVLEFGNDSSWHLALLEAHLRVFFEESYVWGGSFDWLRDPVVLDPGEKETVPLEVSVPPQRLPADAEGGTWEVQVTGLVDVPMLGTKAFRCQGSTPAPGAVSGVR